jgi:hypothetical protein
VVREVTGLEVELRAAQDDALTQRREVGSTQADNEDMTQWHERPGYSKTQPNPSLPGLFDSSPHAACLCVMPYVWCRC